MTDQDRDPSEAQDLHSLEGDLFGALFEFHEKLRALLRAANLDDHNLDIVGERISLLMARATDAVKRTGELDIQRLLDPIYDDVKHLIGEFSQTPTKDGPELE